MGASPRITAGSFRGRILRVPDAAGLRPTPAKVRQAMFNILGDIEGARVLDLFSGSGLMALEALSRGASGVVSVERQRRTVGHLQQVRSDWGLDSRWHIMAGEAFAVLERLRGEQFDLIFADPPYDKGYAERIPEKLDETGIDCRRLVIEESARVTPAWPESWTAESPRRYGDTCLHFLHRC
ncbi:MAG TPA: 16S rRNA (guanine(966)-N(2))-methyltransferase RsmD [Mariprofundaceae bacterium]|nr:16S rRNA (guanine(966)-N(2))-methyltransferase RsmD [Mariprofundaceae bacterium]